MKITFLGTGSAWPIPRIGCGCPQCAAGATDRRDVRSRSAAFLEAADGRALLVDAGPDIYRQLHALGREAVRRIEAVVLTHVHPDHYLGLVDLSAALGGRKPVPFLVLEDNWPAVERTFFYLFDGSTRAPLARARLALDETVEPVPGLRVTPFDARHFDQFQTCGLLVEGDGGRLAYAPDFKETPARERLRGVDLLVLDGSAVDKDIFGHLSIENGIQLARELGARRTLFTHIGHVKVAHADLEKRVAGEGAFGVAHDGLGLTI